MGPRGAMTPCRRRGISILPQPAKPAPPLQQPAADIPSRPPPSMKYPQNNRVRQAGLVKITYLTSPAFRESLTSPARITRWAIPLYLLILVWGLSGCEKVAAVFHRTPLPDLGPRLANSVKLTFDSSFSNLMKQYIDG